MDLSVTKAIVSIDASKEITIIRLRPIKVVLLLILTVQLISTLNMFFVFDCLSLLHLIFLTMLVAFFFVREESAGRLRLVDSTIRAKLGCGTLVWGRAEQETAMLIWGCILVLLGIEGYGRNLVSLGLCWRVVSMVFLYHNVI